MKHAAIIRLFQKAARNDKLFICRHAYEEMDQEGETRQSLRIMLGRAKTVSLQENGRWRVRGERLTVILEIEEETVMVCTVYAG